MAKLKSKTQGTILNANYKMEVLKQEVYRLAKVENTMQLKFLCNNFKKFDFRRKSIWQDVLCKLQDNHSYEQSCFSPTDQFRELFAEADKLCNETKKIIEKNSLLIEQLSHDTADLDELAGEFMAEALTLKSNAVTSALQAHRNRLN